MSFRINTNTQAAMALSSLNKTSNEIGSRQLRLATGSRINSAADDSAGFTISNKLTATTRGQAQALSNIGDAKSMMTVAEGALTTTMDILQTMKEKAVQAGNDSLGADERSAIQSQVDALTAEVNDILGGADFNGKSLFDDTGATALTFQVGDKSGDSFDASIAQMGIGTLSIGSVSAGTGEVASTGTVDVTAGSNYAAWGATNAPTVDATDYKGDVQTLFFKYDDSEDSILVSDTDNFSNPIGRLAANTGDTEFTYNTGDGNITITTDALTAGEDGEGFQVDLSKYTAGTNAGDVTSSLTLTTASGAQTALDTIDAAIKKVNTAAQGLGDQQNRLDFKAQNLETSKTNYEAANSRIADADFAKEQMEVVKLQILQQTGSAMFAQANSSGQSVLSFF
ncbi:flagellin [Rubrivirga sp. IMCC45206]|uniref:flagellin N-terminal helical domain-containing protein n=1 Tax=Rubrivirga sp. IMCC45206 TaxID=3391614 RepID=UPI0039903853